MRARITPAIKAPITEAAGLPRTKSRKTVATGDGRGIGFVIHEGIVCDVAHGLVQLRQGQAIGAIDALVIGVVEHRLAAGTIVRRLFQHLFIQFDDIAALVLVIFQHFQGSG